jgi:hypothetical protein
MKKLLFILFLAVLFSCEKEDLSCYNCKTSARDYTSTITTTCELTPGEALQLQSGLEIQARMMADTTTVVICYKSKCAEI